MTHHYLPPPPFPEGASPWEAVVLEAILPTVRSLARSVRGLEVCDWDADDGAQRMAAEAMQACRLWHRRHGPGRPDARYIWAAVHRARRKLYRSVRRAAPRSALRPGDGSEQEAVIVVPCDRAGPEQVAIEASERAGLARLAESVYQSLSEPDAHLLRLFAGGLSPSEIALEVGRPGDNVAVSQRLYVLRKRAREHLADLGIWVFEDALALAPGDTRLELDTP